MARFATSNSAQFLLDTWGDRLSAEDRGLLAGVAQRTQARLDLAHRYADDPLLNVAGFVLFERVFAQEPLALFGQQTAALAATRVSIRRAERGADGALVPGAPLFVARLSDRALTTMVLNTNRGDALAPLTVEELGGRALPAYVPGTPADDTAFQDAMATSLAKLDSDLAAVAGALAEGGTAKARAAAKKALASTRSRIAGGGDLAFYLEQRLSVLSKRRVELVVEAAHTALHAERVAAALAQPRLPAPEPMPFDAEAERFANPMLDAVLADLTAAEGAAVRRALALEQAFVFGLEIEDGAEITGWLSGQDLARAFYAVDRERAQDGTLRARYEALSNIARSALHFTTTRDPRFAAMGLVQSQGGGPLPHSSLPDRSGNTCSLRVETAWEEGSFGEARLRTDHGPYLEILLTPDDLMLALRGHPTGAMVPCTFRSIAGCWLESPRTSPTRDTDTIVEDVVGRVDASAGTRAALDALAALEAHLDTPSTGKAWKEQAQALMDAATAALGAHKQDLAELGFGDGARAMGSYVGRMVQRDVQEMGKALPNGALPLLLQSASDR